MYFLLFERIMYKHIYIYITKGIIKRKEKAENSDLADQDWTPTVVFSPPTAVVVAQ
jgi:hypothetical protein